MKALFDYIRLSQEDKHDLINEEYNLPFNFGLNIYQFCLFTFKII